MSPKPLSPMKVFVRELRNQGWIPDHMLKRLMAPVLEKGGGLEDLKRSLITNQMLEPGQMKKLDQAVHDYFGSSSQAQLDSSHPDEVLEGLTARLQGEIKEEKELEWDSLRKKREEANQVNASPLKIMIKEIRRQNWVEDEDLKPILAEVLKSQGSPKELMEALMAENLLMRDEVNYLFVHTRETLDELRESSKPLVKDNLSDLERSLGGEMELTRGEKEKKQKKPKKPQLPPEERAKPHSDRIRILSDDPESAFDLFKKDEDDENRSGRLF